MYNHNILIVILSTDYTLQNLFSSLEPDNKLIKLELKTLPSYSSELEKASIVIDTLTDKLENFNNMLSFNGKYILINDDSNLQRILAENFDNLIYDIWSTQDSPLIYKLRFKKLLQQLCTEHDLYLHKSALNTTINSLPDLIWFKHTDGTHIKVNDAFAEMVNKTKTDIEGYDHFHVWGITKEEYENSDYVCVDTDSVVLNTGKADVFDEKVATRKGLRQFRTYKSPILDEKSRIIGTVGIAQDVTEIKNMSTMIDMTFNNLPFAMMVKDTRDYILRVNAKFAETFHCRPQELIGTTLTLENILKQRQQPYIVDDIHNELNLVNPDGMDTFQIGTYPITDYFDKPIGNLYLYRDITAEKLFQNKLKKYAYTDTLTSLYTRRYLHEYIASLEAPQFCNFILVDLDDFKHINDSFGHQCGDEVLEKLGFLMQIVFTDGISIRLGGDEFLIVLPSHKSLAKLKKQLNVFFDRLTAFSNELKLPMPITVSIGTTTGYCYSEDDLAKFIHECDQALYHVKNTGKNSYVIYSEITKNPD